MPCFRNANWSVFNNSHVILISIFKKSYFTKSPRKNIWQILFRSCLLELSRGRFWISSSLPGTQHSLTPQKTQDLWSGT